ncbi:hypothetical protein [Azospirillum griseum]|uniref:C1q domain-containing protein n=1 Tax=Azospirillum griseum TaxID=2496639 RepID=A0A3S0K547_9PROT|nr:hypothetical protein [Azospirillum griseum]RTR20521.1 hypothetical protein EJ903_10355 [Azospirillum griseum]
MATQTFNPSDLSQSATNWAVAQRIVGPFAPHAQVTPNLTLALDPGFLLSGTTLTEVNAQNVGPFAPPSSGFRIDRVVIDRSTGAASIVTGAANSLTPPAIPTGKLPVARVMLEPTTAAIINEIVVDERALSDLNPVSLNVSFRANMNNVHQTGIASSTWTKINFSTTDFNVGGAFDTATSRFKPLTAGNYLVTGKGAMTISPGYQLSLAIYKNGAMYSLVTNYTPYSSGVYTSVSDSVVLNGSTDYIELWCQTNNAGSNTLLGDTPNTSFTATRIS